MTPIVTLVQNTTYDLTPSTMRLPPLLWTAFAAVNKVHGAWRWYRRIDLYRNPDNFAQLLTGHAINFAVGDMFLLRVAAQCLLISTRMLECVQEQTSLIRAGKSWKAAMKGDFPKPVHYSWNAHPKGFWKSPSTVAYWKITRQALWNRVERIAWRTLNIFKHVFQLSMRIMDAIDAIFLSPHTRNEAIPEGFVNVMKWLDAIVENKEELLQGIVDNQKIIERILQNAPITYEELRHRVAKTLDKTEKVYHKAKKISTFGNGVLIDFGKRMISGTMIVMGLARLQPTWLAVQRDLPVKQL